MVLPRNLRYWGGLLDIPVFNSNHQIIIKAILNKHQITRAIDTLIFNKRMWEVWEILRI
jgi:hypothetical protein